MRTTQKNKQWYDQFYVLSGVRTLPSWYREILYLLKKSGNNSQLLLELGCGTGKLLEHLSKNGVFQEKNLYAMDQSTVAVNQAKAILPSAKIIDGDIYDLKYKENFFDYVVMAEVIEHLENPEFVLREIERVLKKRGKLYLSFPNYFNLPWLIVRILAEKLNRPNWIVLQPIDKIYTTVYIKKLCKKVGLRFQIAYGTNYFPPFFYQFESLKITHFLNKLGFNHAAFHPIMVFEKI